MHDCLQAGCWPKLLSFVPLVTLKYALLSAIAVSEGGQLKSLLLNTSAVLAIYLAIPAA